MLEQFQRNRLRQDEIKINENYQIVLSHSLIKNYCKGIQYVELYYDSETKQIGIKPLLEKTPHSFCISGTTTRKITAKRFFEYYSIPLPSKENWSRKVNFKDGILIFDL